MNTLFRRSIRCAAGALALAVSLAGAALPAQAAAKKVTVDNTGHCKGAYTTIQDAIDALGPNPTGTITVCAGTYTSGGVINGANRLRLIARKGVTIAPLPGFSGHLIDVQNSTNVTVQGFTIIGAQSLASSGLNVAINFGNTSGTISKNTITGWREADLSTATMPDNVILVNVSTLNPTKVTITKNTLSDWQGYAIEGFGDTLKVTVSSNKITTTSASNIAPYGITLQSAGASKVTGNTLSSDFGSGGSAASRAIHLVDTGFTRVSGNKISGWESGIAVYGMCFGASTTMTTSNDTVTGNRISQVRYGILVVSDTFTTCTSNIYNAKVKGNKIVNAGAPGLYGIWVVADQTSGGTALAQNELVKGNTITHFTYSTNSGVFLDTLGGAPTPLGVFAPNRYTP